MKSGNISGIWEKDKMKRIFSFKFTGFPAAVVFIAAIFLTFSCISNKTADESVKAKPVQNKKAVSEKSDNRETMSQEVVNIKEPSLDSGKKFDEFIPEIETEKVKEEVKRNEPFYKEFLKDVKDEPIEVKINFDATPLSDIIPAFVDILKFNYVVDPKVSGSVTMSLEAKLTKREIWQTFEQILWFCGAYCTPEGGILHIFPMTKMPQEHRIFDKDKPANIEVCLFKPDNIPVKNLTEVLKPFMTEGAKVVEMPEQNSILVIESPENAAKLNSLFRMVDKRGRATWPKTAIRCENVPVSRIKNELASILPILGFPVSVDTVTVESGAVHITSIDRIQALVASAANTEALIELKKWAAILDNAEVGEQERIFVYKVVNSTADDLLKAISALFLVESTSLSVEGASTDKSQTSTNVPASSETKNKNSTSSASSASSSVYDTPVKIFADGKHNRLTLKTTPKTYAIIKALLDRLDTVPSQVLLQVMIAEVNLYEETQFGLEYSAKFVKGRQSNTVATNFSDLNAGSATEYGMNYWIQNTADEDKFAYIRALAGTDNTKVLSSPQIIAVSHMPAEIQVGDKVPIVTSENTDTASNTTINRSIEYQDTGIIMKLTPHVTEGGLVLIELEQTVSDAVATTTSGIDSPTLQERTLKTSLAIRDGGTLIVGGLITDRQVVSQDSFPFISKIPLLAYLTGFNDTTTRRVELLVMITATVVTEKTDVESMMQRYKEAVKLIQNFENKNGTECEQ